MRAPMRAAGAAWEAELGSIAAELPDLAELRLLVEDEVPPVDQLEGVVVGPGGLGRGQ